MKDRIIELLNELQRPMSPDEIAEQLTPEDEVYIALNELEAEGRIMLTKRGEAALPEQLGLVYGRVQGNPKGFGFFVPVNGGKDMFIAADDMNGAMHGDMVWGRVTAPSHRFSSPSCEVASIAKRGNTSIIGTYEQDGEYGGYVIPDDARIFEDMLIPQKESGKAVHGDKVMAQIVQYPGARRPLIGKITEVLGKAGDKGVDILSIIRRLDLPVDFPKAAQKQAAAMVKPIGEDELKGRRDYRDILTITIDGADAKDLDDAVSLQRTEKGSYILGVHIADVSHYVRENGPLDKEAYKRGTSVYFPDRVLPMLPKELSNGICSLNPKEDKLTMSCVMKIDDSGRVTDYTIAESVIRSNYRMTYEDVNAMFAGDGELLERYAEIVPMLTEMRELMGILRGRRIRMGSIDFDIPEAEITLDDKGHAVEVGVHERGEANRMIEEFMLMANQTVARHGFDAKLPLVYRIHETPDEERVTELNEFLQTLGYGFKRVEGLKPMDVQRLLNKAKGTPEESVVNQVALRSMTKAKYSPQCGGHFGLAMDYYCHFTSPIRRYPDLMVHRALKDGIHRTFRGKRREKWEASLQEMADHCSDRELVSVEAERAADDLKKCEYIHDHLGEEFDGTISGMVQQGFFVALDNTIEGLVRAQSLMDDYYVWDECRYRFVAKGSGKQYRLGDRVKVRVLSADMDTSKVGFELVTERGRYIRADRSKLSKGRKPGKAGKQDKPRSTKADKDDKIVFHHKKKGGSKGGHSKGSKKGRGKPKGQA